MKLTPTQMREKRLNAGLSLTAAAAELGVPKRLLVELENGKETRPHPANAKRLADFYETTVVEQWPLPEDIAA